MRANSPDAWTLSVVFHAFVIGIVAAITWWIHRAPEIQPLVFELVEFSDSTVTPAGEPDMSPVKFVQPKVQKITPPPPQPARPAETKPTPKTEAPAPKPVQKVETPKTPSYEEFLRNQAKTLEKNANPPPRQVKTPKIDTKAITRELQQYARAGVKDGAMSAAQARELDAYISRLITALRMAHEKPDGLSDLLKAKVSFYVAKDGTLSSVKIISSSGDAEFDRSVIEAFRKVRSIGPVPAGKSYTWELTFRMLEE